MSLLNAKTLVLIHTPIGHLDPWLEWKNEVLVYETFCASQTYTSLKLLKKKKIEKCYLCESVLLTRLRFSLWPRTTCGHPNVCRSWSHKIAVTEWLKPSGSSASQLYGLSADFFSLSVFSKSDGISPRKSRLFLLSLERLDETVKYSFYKIYRWFVVLVHRKTNVRNCKHAFDSRSAEITDESQYFHFIFNIFYAQNPR